MQKQTVLVWLVPLIALLATISASAGLFVTGGTGPYPFETLRGQTVMLYGRGLYANDSLFFGAAFRGTDVVTLLVGVPLLLISYGWSRRNALKGQIALIGVLYYFLYNGASLTFAAAFNPCFLLYTALFSASLFAVIVALVTYDTSTLARQIGPAFPHRRMAVFMISVGIAMLLLWLSEVIEPVLTGHAPELLGSYTTLFTHGFDLAVIAPAAISIGVLLWQRNPAGYLLAAPLLILCTLIGIVVIAQTISQAMAGLILPVGVYIGMVGSWVVMGAFAIGLTLAYFRSLATPSGHAMAEPLR
jgi:hypothetical protein